MSTSEEVNLVTATDIDLATTPLNYEKFKLLAQNPNLSPEERIGFPDSYRAGFEDSIIADISNKLNNLSVTSGAILDIGCGASPLTYKLLEILQNKGLDITLVDSEEMLAHIPDDKQINKISGLFPDNIKKITQSSIPSFDYILCYSVLHYIYIDTNLFAFLDNVISLLKPGGVALIGDIPNISKRKRFFSSQAGKDYHKKFMNTDKDPVVDFLKVELDQIDDAVLASMIQRAQYAGCDAYLLPQNKDLPMYNRRDDLLIRKN